MSIDPSATGRPPEDFANQMSAPAYTQDRLDMPLIEQIWLAVRNNKWLLLSTIGACVLLGMIITLLTTPLYTGSALIEISRQQGNFTGVESVDQDDRSRDLEFYDTQYSLLEARSLAERVVREEKLISNDDFFNTYGISPQSEGLLEGGDQERGANAERKIRFELAVKTLLQNVSIVPVRGSSLVEVRYTSPDPALSARVTNVWIEQFIDSNLDRRFGSTQDAREFLEGQLELLEKRLGEAETSLVNYAAENGIVTLSQQQDSLGRTTSTQTLASADLEAMNSALAQARADRIAAQSAAQFGNGARDALVNPAINTLRARRADIASERARLLATFEPEYPTVAALTSQLENLDRSISQETARVRSASVSGFNEARQREQQLEAQVNELRDRFSTQNRDSIQYNIYQREVDTTRELYEGLLQRYKEIGVAGVAVNNVAVVDLATVPGEPSSPNLPLNLVLAVLAGVILSTGIIFAREKIDQTIRDPADIRKVLGLTVLGTAPSQPGVDIVEELLDPKSVLSEAYFSAGTNLSFATEHGVPRTIVITSTQPNEGKTTSSFALASVLARTGKRILLVDADMRNPSVHKLFDQDNEKGLSNFLSGDDDLSGIILPTGGATLSLLPAGPLPPNPSELLSGTRLRMMIERLSNDFDHILFDAPPILGLADVPLLASTVEGVVFTVEANQAKQRTLQSAIQRLRQSNSHIFGAIVTKVDTRNSAFGYGYGYGYGYSYGGNEKA